VPVKDQKRWSPAEAPATPPSTSVGGASGGCVITTAAGAAWAPWLRRAVLLAAIAVASLLSGPQRR
jgi:hypothetical protein